MSWSHTNTLTLNPGKELKAELGLQLEILKAEIEQQKECVRERKLKLHHATDQWTRIRDAYKQPHSWLIYQLSGGNTRLKKQMKTLIKHYHQEALEQYDTQYAYWQAEERYLDNHRERLERVVMRHRMVRDQADIVVSKDMLDRSLRDNAYYVPDSLQLSYNNEPMQQRVTFSLRDIIATNPRGNNPIEIPPLRIDFYIYPNGEHDLVVRNDIGRPYWTDRYKGYSELALLHPHMTGGTSLCLGDFGEGVTEAISEGDFVTAITILTMFFQQYDPDDSAGAYHDVWPDADEDRHIADYADA
jgi:hypothetical protein